MEILLIIAAFLAGGDGEEASVSSVSDIFQLCASEMKSQIHSAHLVSGLSHSSLCSTWWHSGVTVYRRQ